MCDKVIKINYRREMRSLINQIKHIGLNSDGILFGGIVRDDIIGTHYRNLFIEKKMNFDKYWDNSYDIETKYRTILPNDIDIFFLFESAIRREAADIHALTFIYCFNINGSIVGVFVPFYFPIIFFLLCYIHRLF